MAWMLVLMVPSEITQAIYSRDTHEFLRPRPVTNGQIVVAGLVIPLLIALSLPALALALVDRDWINRGGLFFKPPFASTLEYLRVVLGATFLPEKWPPGGLTVEMWQKLRPLLYMDVLRMTCLILASLFSKAGVNRGASKNRGPVSSVNMALMIITFVCGMRLSLPGGGGSFFGSLPMPSVWFAALLAVVTIVSWDRHRRALIAPR